MYTLAELKEQVAAAGYTPSEGSTENERCICAFSVEHFGPAAYNGSRYLLVYDKQLQQLQVTGKPNPAGMRKQRNLS